MLAHSDIQRSVGKMTIDLHQAITTRAGRADLYRQGEIEWQAQYSFSGDIDSLPAEATITIPFAVHFAFDAGYRRDSTLDRPHARLSTELTLAPAGVVPYAYVLEWTYDDDLNYVGAVVMVGVHSPAAAAGQPPATTAFQGILHAAFQGYGADWDPDGTLDSGGTVDN